METKPSDGPTDGQSLIELQLKMFFSNLSKQKMQPSFRHRRSTLEVFWSTTTLQKRNCCAPFAKDHTSATPIFGNTYYAITNPVKIKSCVGLVVVASSSRTKPKHRRISSALINRLETTNI